MSGNHRSHEIKPEQGNLEYLPLYFLPVALYFLHDASEPGSLGTLSIVFVSIVLEAIPFMLIGSLVGGLIEAFVSRERLVTMLPKKGWLTVFAAAGAGIVFPVCECAVIPVVRRLIGKGLPFYAAIAYLLGGPIVNPIVAASTALAYNFDWRIVILRLTLGYFIAVVIGLVMGKMFKSSEVIRNNDITVNNVAASCGCGHNHPEHSHFGMGIGTPGNSSIVSGQADLCAHGCNCADTAMDSWINKILEAFVHAKNDFLAVGHYLIIGAFIAALAQTYIDRASFLNMTGAPIVSVVLMMALAIMLNLCSEADAFIAASFRFLAPLPAQMAFMLTGPMFDLKLLLMYQTIFQRRAITILSILILSAVLTVTCVLELLMGVIL